jgi:hypothetical protein
LRWSSQLKSGARTVRDDGVGAIVVEEESELAMRGKVSALTLLARRAIVKKGALRFGKIRVLRNGVLRGARGGFFFVIPGLGIARPR